MSDHARLHGPLAPIQRDRLQVHAPDAAVALLGAVLVREEAEGERVVARVVETEAYREDDPASHSHAKRTTRSEPMFWRAGTSYVYRSYGVHWCLNISVEPADVGAAVLIRAATVLEGAELVAPRRTTARSHRELLRGPGRLTKGLDLDAPRHDRGDVIDGVGGLRVADDGWRPDPSAIVAGPRVGVSLAAEMAWRFHLDGVAEVSPYRRSPRAAPPTHR
jgi:DNA-3-methyladenine glycosylase